MRYAIIENAAVVNVAVGDAQLANNWVASDVAQIGWTYESGNFLPPAPPAPEIPSVVTMRQARLAMLAAGRLADVDAAIAALPSPDKEAVQIEWEYAAEVRRDHAWVQQLGDALELDLDALFVSASGY